MTSVQRLLSALACAGALAACAVAPAPTGPQPSKGRLITAEQIQRSGARTAWDVLERQPGLLRMGAGYATSYRAVPGGPSSGEPLLLVDGARMTDLGALRQIPAESVQSIEYLSAVNAPTIRGPGSANGVIIVRTAPPARR